MSFQGKNACHLARWLTMAVAEMVNTCCPWPTAQQSFRCVQSPEMHFETTQE